MRSVVWFGAAAVEWRGRREGAGGRDERAGGDEHGCLAEHAVCAVPVGGVRTLASRALSTQIPDKPLECVDSELANPFVFPPVL